jgi:adenylate cyclase
VTVPSAWLRRARLGSGLVLFAYLLTHFTNHALGLISLETMDAGEVWFLRLWRSFPGTVALYGALFTHIALALVSLYRRRHLRMPPWEGVQLLLGLVIPPLLAGHVVGIRLAAELYGTSSSYTRVVLGLWHLAPALGLKQALVVLVAWTHGCMGLHYWLRLQRWYAHVRGPALAVAVVVPLLALLGFAAAGRRVDALARYPAWVGNTLAAAHVPTPAQRARLLAVENAIIGGYAIAIALVMVGRAVRTARQSRHRLTVTYPDGRAVTVPLGFSVLEASRAGGIPHASVCGGRGRCSTCRVRVMQGLDKAPPPSADELKVLARVGAPANVRLACQLRPTADVAVAPLLPPSVAARDAGVGDAGAGREQEVAVLFADLRGFTTVAERKLPYDVVFILNRYFEAVGGAIARAGGIANQFTGDGVMALFGLTGDARDGCRRALAAAGEIVASLDRLNRALADELPLPLKIGIGIHVGPTVVGRMGYGDAVYFTAVGDTVNAASRLEQLTKRYECELIISEKVGHLAGLDVSGFDAYELELRNRRAPLTIRVIPRAVVAGATFADVVRAPDAVVGF